MSGHRSPWSEQVPFASRITELRRWDTAPWLRQSRSRVSYRQLPNETGIAAPSPKFSHARADSKRSGRGRYPGRLRRPAYDSTAPSVSTTSDSTGTSCADSSTAAVWCFSAFFSRFSSLFDRGGVCSSPEVWAPWWTPGCVPGDLNAGT